ncbi:DUF302 domain-containing protein [Pedobacter caeni]|uniref:Uncharacterized conserved protein, DUF302 family n=1 Tax=Pedobacter caeni TaxID=288992 RepID=A0A1M5ASI8_9SPHI|nr:DUF302 domain-containing protein [Pedobacter caeni]SHF33228.1 Uncharacterized conserved protein, DUF302 family [Pedobacter caeni]
MNKKTGLLLLAIFIIQLSFAQDSQKAVPGVKTEEKRSKGIVSVQSHYSVKESMDRLVSIVESKGMTVFLRMDHAKNAEKDGLALRPTELLFFGNPKAGTILMQDQQISGLDLPLKVLVWEDETGKVWLNYNDVNWIAERHGLTEKSKGIKKTMESVMAAVVNAAAKTNL